MPLKDLEARRAYDRKRYLKRGPQTVERKAALAAARRRRHKDDPSKMKNNHLKCTFGITLVEYNQMFEEQQGCCAICGKHQASEKRALAVDHDHETGRIRGLLCSGCNQGIGHLKDDITILRKAIAYLEKK